MGVVDVALICRALSDANRLQIVRLLTGGEQCACKLLEHFQITQPTLSHRRWTFYSLNCDVLTAFRDFIAELNCDGR